MLSLISEIHSARRLMLSGHAREALAKLNGQEAACASLAIVRGECHYVLGEWNEAVREFEAALRLSPNSPRAEILLELSAEMVELSKTLRPAATVEQLLGVPPTEPIPSFPKLSPARDIQEDTNQPAPGTEGAPATDEIGMVSETLAELMIRQKKYNDARKVYIQLARLNPDRYEYFRDKINSLEEGIG